MVLNAAQRRFVTLIIIMVGITLITLFTNRNGSVVSSDRATDGKCTITLSQVTEESERILAYTIDCLQPMAGQYTVAYTSPAGTYENVTTGTFFHETSSSRIPDGTQLISLTFQSNFDESIWASIDVLR